MKLPLAMSILLLGACRPEFASIQDACIERVPGQGAAPADAIRFVKRVNCYRRYAGAGRGRVDDLMSEAADNHAGYLQTNGVHANGGDYEDPTLPGFTGITIEDRLRAVGYDQLQQQETQVGWWEAVWIESDDASEEELVDQWVDDVYFRQVVLQPSWRDSGFGRTEDYVVGLVSYAFPASQNVNRPVVYPVDGQSGVPTTYFHGYAGDVVPAGEPLGYPVLISVGSASLDATITDDNPYDLVLIESTIAGPAGLVEHHVLQPSSALGDFPASVALVPTEPLAPLGTYTWTVVLSWDSATRKELTGSFQTRAAEPPVTRGASLYLRHRTPDGREWRYEPGAGFSTDDSG